MNQLKAVFLMFTTLGFNSVLADDEPIYFQEILELHIPSAGSAAIPGAYQEAVFQYIQQDLWRLVHYADGVEIRGIENVELIRTQSFPVQVFLKVTGIFTNSCFKVGQVSDRQVDNTFKVFIYYDLSELGPGVGCLDSVAPFTKIIPLSVYDLKAGQYSYSVNNSHTGTFSLAVDNKL